jgi:glycosyltransferase involved in cell wall biosynthesis
MMRVALIGPVPEAWGGPPRGGGVSSYIQGLATALADLDVQISLLGDNTNAAPGPLPAAPPAPIQFYPMFRLADPIAPQSLLRLGPARVAGMAARLVAQRDVRLPLSRRLRYMDRAANYDLFLHQAKPQLLHVAHAEFRQFLSQRIAQTSVPVVASVLSATVLLRPTPDWLVQMTIQNYNLASRLIVCSGFVKQVIAPHVADPDKMTIIPNGVDTEYFRPGSQTEARAALGLAADEFVVLYTGGLVTPKGVEVLLRAFARGLEHHGDARLIFVGAGPEAPSLEKLAAELGVAQQVTLAGYRPTDELPTWYTACDVFALPSQSEGLSISLLEAMASGRAVLTTPPEVGDHDAVEEGVNGLLCPYGDVDALAMALSRLAHSPDETRQMGIAARQKTERRFAWPVIAQQVAKVYLEARAEVEGAA